MTFSDCARGWIHLDVFVIDVVCLRLRQTSGCMRASSCGMGRREGGGI
jgi:hypothetical protein